jgi:hypothetical protein
MTRKGVEALAYKFFVNLSKSFLIIIVLVFLQLENHYFG